MERRKIHIILFVALVIATLYTGLFSLRRGIARIEDKIDYSFKEAINKDYANRLSYLNYYNSDNPNFKVNRYVAAPVVDRKIKNYALRTWKGRTVYSFKDSLDEQMAKPLLAQYILSQLNPIKEDELDEIFQKFLKKHDVAGRTGVFYWKGDMLRHSRSDSIAPASAYLTPEYILDINGEVRVQAWVDYGFMTVAGHSEVLLWMACLLVFVIMFTCYYRKECRRTDGQSGIENMVIDLEKQELFIDGVQCPIQKLDLALLHLFKEKVGNCVERDEIKQLFWPTDDNANEKIDAHIKAIRKILKEFPAYRLVVVRGKGYYLSANFKC